MELQKNMYETNSLLLQELKDKSESIDNTLKGILRAKETANELAEEKLKLKKMYYLEKQKMHKEKLDVKKMELQLRELKLNIKKTD